MLLNIIHPYTYKVNDNKTLVVGSIKEFKERDKKINSLVKKILDSKGKIINQNYSSGNVFEELLYKSALYEDKIFKFLFDKTTYQVTTTCYGTPIPDSKPDNIKEDIWKILTAIYTKHSELKTIIESHKKMLFIGGTLEACLPNAILYFYDKYKIPNENLLYVPEICVSFEQDKAKSAIEKLTEKGILPIKFKDAIRL